VEECSVEELKRRKAKVEAMSEVLQEQVRALARRDGRYKPEAYLFVFQSLQFAQEELGCGASPAPITSPEEVAEERHVRGQQLCEAARQLALRQFGYLAEVVLKCWGITLTSDFGEIVFRLIDHQLMKKTADDRREDFENVFDFRTGLGQGFRIEMPD
jgi:uncharacterized repeat protein (TIGR04138 family)